MPNLSFRRSIQAEFLAKFPGYLDFTISLSSHDKTYRSGTFLRLDIFLAVRGFTERERDEGLCEILGYGHLSPGEPLPRAYRVLKSRAKVYRGEWLSSHLTVGCSYVEAA